MESSSVLSESTSSDVSTTSFKTSLAWNKKLANSSPLKASQNSSCAVLWSNPFTRSTSLAPGNSTKIRPELPIRCMLGCVTPNLSIRFLRTSKAETIDSSIFADNIGFTSSSLISKVISSLSVLLAKISGEAKFASASIASNATKKSSK